MPQLHLSRRTGKRLLATGAIAAVAVFGTPSIASANPLTDAQEQLEGAITGGTEGGGTGGGTGGSVPALPGGGGEGTAPGSAPDPTESISAGATCVEGLVTGIQVSVTGIAEGLRDALIGFLGGGGETTVPVTDGTATTTLAVTPDQLADLLDLSPERLAELLADGQDSLEMTVEVVVGGVTQLVGVVIDFVECLASLIPAPAEETTPPPSAAPVSQAPAPVPAVTTSAAPAQAVAYPGYAQTGGAPGEDGSPVALVGLGLLTAATGGGALWLRARRGVAG